ncbi:MAG: S9 family peptidase [Chitinophagales bacterium]
MKTFGFIGGLFLGMVGFVMMVTSSNCKETAFSRTIDDSAQIVALIKLDRGKIPVEDFFKNPEKTAFCISPDGAYVSYLGPVESRLNIFVQKADGNSPPVQVTTEIDRDISYYFWKNDNTLLYIKDSGGDENYKLFAINKDGSGKRDLTPEKNVRIEIIDELRDFPDEVIISMNKNNPALFEPYRINIRTGEKKQLADNRDMMNPVTIWKADNLGRLRLAVSVEKGTKTHLLYRDTENDPFRSIITSDWKDMVEPLFFDEENKFIYALSNLNRDKAALVKIDPNNADHPEIILEHPDVDIMYAERSPKKHKLISSYFATDKKHIVFFDETLNRIHAELEAKFPGSDIYFNSFDDDEKNIIVRTYNDRSPGDFYLYKVDDNSIIHLAEINPRIKPEEMCAMEPISYYSRDSLLINGYLTLPNVANKSNLPVVILVHGGPMARDYWGYRADVQLLASRGYAVYQVNFRGSWGYGKKFAVSGFKEWGKKMQDDITDGVEMLIEKGIADKNNIAIYGSSYGGYAALAGITFTPELYVCAIDYVGPSNLFTLLKNLPSYWEPEKEMMYEMIGHPVKDSILLYEASPVFHPEKIKVPVFIAQGANDPRVKRNESEQMVDALRTRNIDVVYLLKENEGHGFKLEENRLEFYKTMMGFLAKHLKSAEPLP